MREAAAALGVTGTRSEVAKSAALGVPGGRSGVGDGDA